MTRYMRLFASAMAVMLLLGALTACNNGAAPKPSDPTGVADPAVKLDPAADPAKDPFGKYDPPIEVTTIHTSNEVSTNLKNGDTIENNIYTRTWEEKLGIKLKYKWTSPGTQGGEKMNIMIASGDLPDFFYIDQTQFEKLYSTGQLEDIGQELDDYATKYTKKYLTGDYAGLLDGVTRGGKVYGVPNGQTYHDSGWMYWIKEDWLKKLNMAVPKNLAELETFVDAIVNKDPDGNGQKDTYMATVSGWWGVGNAFFNSFHSYPDTWVKNSKGELEDGMFGPEHRENTRKALLRLQDYYKKGYIHPDFATQDDAKRTEMITNGKVGVTFGGLWDAWWPLPLDKDTNPAAEWVPVEILSADDKPAKTATTAAIVLGINVAKKGTAHPEALIKMCNLFHDMNNNPETMRFGEFNTDPTDNAGIFLTYPMLIYNPSFNYEAYLQIKDAVNTGKDDGLCEAYKMFYNQIKSYSDTGDKAGWPSYRSYTDVGSLGVVDRYIKNKGLQFNEYTGQPTQFMIDNNPVIKKAYDEMFLKVVMGEDISLYDDFLKQYDTIFLATSTKEVNDWFKAKGSQSIQDAFDK